MTNKYNPKHINGIVTGSAINENLDDIQEALEASLSKEPEAGNEMKDDLDMNSYRVTNLKDGQQNQDAVTVHQVGDLVREDLENLGTLDVDITGTAANATHAVSADHASYADDAGHSSNADQANNAYHASVADSADALGGVPPEEWQRKAKNNYNATTDPGYGDDETEGYTEGSLWFNRDDQTAWVCLSAQTNNATWVQTNISAQQLGSAAFQDHGTGLGDVPLNSDLGSASLEDVGTSNAENVPQIKDLSSTDTGKG